jgi:hypothetical protein
MGSPCSFDLHFPEWLIILNMLSYIFFGNYCFFFFEKCQLRSCATFKLRLLVFVFTFYEFLIFWILTHFQMSTWQVLCHILNADTALSIFLAMKKLFSLVPSKFWKLFAFVSCGFGFLSRKSMPISNVWWHVFPMFCSSRLKSYI